MSDNIAIKVENVYKTFKLPHEKVSSVKSAVINFYTRKRTYEKQQVLNDISFEIKKGEFFGIVGRNGSGKSTLLKLLAGIYSPDSGQIHVNGKLTPFIELGVGFNPELTGRENIFLNGALLGFERKEVNSMYDEIVDFAELEQFMDQKLKNYSSGMQVRLAFSIAIRAQSDILLLDEVLAVGDAAFQTKCFNYFHELKRQKATVILVSHDRGALERFCDSGIFIDKGNILYKGNIKDVLNKYNLVVLDQLTDNTSKRSTSKHSDTKSKYAEILETKTINSSGKIEKRFSYQDNIKVSFTVKALKNISNPLVGLTIWKRNVNEAIYATNTAIQNTKEAGTVKRGEIFEFTVDLPNVLNDGEYLVEPAVANAAGTIVYDQQINANNFFISGSTNPHSLIATKDTAQIKKIKP